MNLDLGNEHHSYDLNHGQRDLHPLLLDTDRGLQENHVATLLPHTLHHNNVIADDEISDKTDTFAPFQSVKEATDFIDQITFEGDDDLQQRCKALCRKCKHLFKDSLNPEPADIPPFDLSVNDTQWKIPSNRGPVRVQSPVKEAALLKLVTSMLALGVIPRSSAAHYSQIIMVKKPDGTRRFCFDFRGINLATLTIGSLIPNPKGVYTRVGDAKPTHFGVVDLTSGYHQAPLSQNARKYTAFICFAGIFEFTRLPFGLKSAPTYFQEQMATVVLAGLIYLICEIYLDDCIIYGRGNDQFLARMEEVFKRFSKHKILLQPKKCKFGLSKIEYVGRQISKEGTSMTPEKVRSVADFPKPTTNTSMRSFLGLANYMRDFVPNHSHIAHPLHAMIDQTKGKRHSLVWNAEAEKAFIDLKNLISKAPLLYFANNDDPITLMTDASDYGIGGHLTQEVEGQHRTIAFVSKSLTEGQLRWSVIQKEAYAIFYCCTHLEHLLRDRHFTIKTDHKNLTFLSLDSNAIVILWYIALQELDYSLEFVPGSPAMPMPLPNHLANMLKIQDRLTNISRDLLISQDEKHLAQNSRDITEFVIGTHVLVAYQSGPPTRLLTRWKGPMKVLSSQDSEYLLLDLVSGKEKLFHVKNMRAFHFSPSKVDPLDIARRDYDEFFVERILEHEGDFRKVSTLFFLVRWHAYSSEHDSWEPWKNLLHSEQLHLYLHSIGKSKVIPKKK